MKNLNWIPFFSQQIFFFSKITESGANVNAIDEQGLNLLLIISG